METIPLPNKITISEDSENPNKGVVTIEPLYPGYGPTIANSLRRVMLNSMVGGSLYAFKIKGVTHEFTSIEYVKEDVVDISLNLKQVNLKVHSDEPVELKVNVTGKKILTAGDIEKNSDVEVLNPDQTIMTLTDKAANIEMTLWAKAGRGYVPVEAREDEELEVNAIAIDSIFTPVREIGYEVSNVRVGDRTDFDKVEMQIETNGVITVKEALQSSAKILTDHFSLISENSFSTTDSEKDSGEEASSEEVEDQSTETGEPKKEETSNENSENNEDETV